MLKPNGAIWLIGSYHNIFRLGAEVQGKAACNGWTYWHYEQDGHRRPIDGLRAQARQQLGL